MAGTQDFEPTERELEILNVLWDRGPSTVRTVHRTLGADAVARTTVLKLMQIMFEKGIVTRDESDYSHVYAATRPREAVETQLVNRFVDRVFRGSAMSLVARALDAKAPSAEELAEIRSLIEEAEREEGRG